MNKSAVKKLAFLHKKYIYEYTYSKVKCVKCLKLIVL